MTASAGHPLEQAVGSTRTRALRTQPPFPPNTSVKTTEQWAWQTQFYPDGIELDPEEDDGALLVLRLWGNTLQNIADFVGRTVSTVSERAKRLQAQGHLFRPTGTSQTSPLYLTPKGYAAIPTAFKPTSGRGATGIQVPARVHNIVYTASLTRPAERHKLSQAAGFAPNRMTGWTQYQGLLDVAGQSVFVQVNASEVVMRIPDIALPAREADQEAENMANDVARTLFLHGLQTFNLRPQTTKNGRPQAQYAYPNHPVAVLLHVPGQTLRLANGLLWVDKSLGVPEIETDEPALAVAIEATPFQPGGDPNAWVQLVLQKTLQ